jgi:hypothetical protein
MGTVRGEGRLQELRGTRRPGYDGSRDFRDADDSPFGIADKLGGGIGWRNLESL